MLLQPVKVIMNPAGGNIVARGKFEGPKCGGMVSTFINQISTVTVHVLHGESKFVLSAYHGPLTCECQLHTCTSMDRAQANSSSMLGIIEDTRLLVTSHWTMWTKKRRRFNHGSHFSSVVGMCFGTKESEMSLGGDDGTKHDINSSMDVGEVKAFRVSSLSSAAEQRRFAMTIVKWSSRNNTRWKRKTGTDRRKRWK